jgi:hypothetical protein
VALDGVHWLPAVTGRLTARTRQKDVDLMILFGALILFGSVTFAVAVVRLVHS